jgi:hypothetical protein
MVSQADTLPARHPDMFDATGETRTPVNSVKIQKYRAGLSPSPTWSSYRGSVSSSVSSDGRLMTPRGDLASLPEAVHGDSLPKGGDDHGSERKWGSLMGVPEKQQWWEQMKWEEVSISYHGRDRADQPPIALSASFNGQHPFLS